MDTREEVRLKKLEKLIKKKTNITDPCQYKELAQGLDDFAKLILQNYLYSKKNESHNIL